MDASYIAIGVAIGFVLWKVYSARRSPAQLAEIQGAIDRGAVVLDVRSPTEFASGHLPGARNVPVASVGGSASALVQDGVPVVVYCASGTRSAMAARQLRGAGVAEVFDLGPMGNGAALRMGPQSSDSNDTSA